MMIKADKLVEAVGTMKAATVVTYQPGDTIVFCVSEQPPMYMAQHVIEEMKKHLPDVKVLFVAGVYDVKVLRNTEA